MTDAHREIERKLRVDALFRLPPLTELEGVQSVEAQPTVTLHNHYFDTPDLRLFRWGITLRRREGGGDEGWHLKIPVGDADSGARDEIRAPLQPELPEELRGLITAFVRDEEPVPLVTLRTERTPYLLHDESGVVRGELVDDSVTVLDGHRTVAMFRELEVEAVPDFNGFLDEDFIDHVAEALAECGAVPSTMSKAATALGPRTLAPPDIPTLPWPRRRDPVGDTVHVFLAQHVRRLILEDLRVRRDLPDAVHQMRVNARRLRSGLKAFRTFIDPEVADHLRVELGWMASGLGEARDAEVLGERLDQHAQELPMPQAREAQEIVDAHVRLRVAEGALDAGAVLNSDRYRALLVELVAVAQRPPLTRAAEQPSGKALTAALTKSTTRLERAVAALSTDGPAEPWHEARIVAKRARYLAEACAPVLGKRTRTLAVTLAEVTDVLGTHHDAHIAQLTLAALAREADGVGGFALGMLQQVEVSAERADRREFERLWPSVTRAIRRTRE